MFASRICSLLRHLLATGMVRHAVKEITVKRLGRTLIPIIAASLCCVNSLRDSALAQQLSIRRYGVSDGLAHSSVHSIHQDKKGYIWIGTREGLSRFDGYRFTNYGVRDGLGHAFVNAVAEDQGGRLWVGTNGAGVACMIAESSPVPSQSSPVVGPEGLKFRSFPVGSSAESNRVNAIAIDSNNDIWCATDGGLYRAAGGAGREDPRFEVVIPHEPVAMGMTALADSRGRLWFGIANELIQVVQGHFNIYRAADEVGRFAIAGIAEDRDGRLFVANSQDLFEFIAPADSVARGTWRRLPDLDQLQRMPFLTESVTASTFHSLAGRFELGIHSLAADSTGTLWIGTERGLIKRKDGKQSFYTHAEGLSSDIISALYEDRDGNLWIGTAGGGLCKLSPELFVSFKENDGLPDVIINRVVESATGRTYASTAHAGFAEIKDGKAIPIASSQRLPFSNAGTRLLQDRHGDWWIGTDRGLYLFNGPELQLSRGRRLSEPEGLPVSAVYWLFEDREGTIWVGLDGHGLYYSHRVSDTVFHALATDSVWTSVIIATNDWSGTLWLGKWGVLGRLIGNRIVLLEPSDGLPETDPRSLFLDSRGWLWIGLRNKGVSVTKDPTSEHPTFINYSSENGLASDTIWSITEDQLGRIYLGNGRGLDRLNPKTGGRTQVN